MIFPRIPLVDFIVYIILISVFVSSVSIILISAAPTDDDTNHDLQLINATQIELNTTTTKESNKSSTKKAKKQADFEVLEDERNILELILKIEDDRESSYSKCVRSDWRLSHNDRKGIQKIFR